MDAGRHFSTNPAFAIHSIDQLVIAELTVAELAVTRPGMMDPGSLTATQGILAI